jgi:hypothetical protein
VTTDAASIDKRRAEWGERLGKHGAADIVFVNEHDRVIRGFLWIFAAERF